MSEPHCCNSIMSLFVIDLPVKQIELRACCSARLLLSSRRGGQPRRPDTLQGSADQHFCTVSRFNRSELYQ